MTLSSPETARDGPLGSYSTWRQVAGYFDGDGNVGLEVVKRVLRLRIRFVDTWKPQIDSIWKFLRGQGISTSRVGRDRKEVWQAAYRLDIVEVRSVLRAAKAMLRFTVKKREDLRIAIAYLEAKTTGNEAIQAFNLEVREGRRRGKLRDLTVPYNRTEGLRISQLENAQKARAVHAVNVRAAIKEQIQRDHRELKLGHIRLAKKYGYSVSVIRRILGAT
jgi:hypothetical protein